MHFDDFESGRASFSHEDLKPYVGAWVAFSADGSRILASASNLIKLRDLVAAAGEDPENVGYERIDLNDSWQGAGVELS